MKFIFILILFICIIPYILSVICNFGNEGYSISQVDTNSIPEESDYLCISYQYNCSGGNKICTTQEQSAQTLKWVYSLTSNASCQEMIATPSVYINLLCCHTDLCNKVNAAISIKPIFLIYVMFITFFFIFK